MTTYYNAEFAAEFIVKRDPDGNWCRWVTDHYESLITGLNEAVYCMAEGPDGKVYVGGFFTNAGGTAEADYLARWDPVLEKWEAVIAGINALVFALAFDANGDLYVGGNFTNLGSTAGDYIVKITDVYGTPTVNALGTGVGDVGVNCIAIAPNGDVYVGGSFGSAGGVANTAKIARWNGTVWSALSTGLNNSVYALAFAPNGDLFIGGAFTNAAYPYICKRLIPALSDVFNPVGTAGDIGASVLALAFAPNGVLIVGGDFTNAGGIANADYITRWNGTVWSALSTGTNGDVYNLAFEDNKLYSAGLFTSAGELSLTDRVAIWANGAWQPLDIDLPGTAIVYSVLPASDGSLYVGGVFSTAGETPDENAVCGISYSIEVAEEIEEAFDTDDLDPVDGTGV